MNNLTSIIIPCYNYGEYLEECVNSIINNNTSLDIEIIIIDDCSTDNSFDVAKVIAKNLKNCSIYRNPVNKKLPITRNIGMALSKGDYIICLDADDLIPENYIQLNYETLKEGYDISYSDSQCFGVINKRFNWPDFDAELLKKSNFIHCASMFKRHVLEIVGGFDESFVYGSEDYDFWLMCLDRGFKFKKCKETYLLYRRTYKSMIDKVSKYHVKEIKEKLKTKHGV